MHDALFAHQHHLDRAGLERQGEMAGVSPTALRAVLDNHRFAERVERDVRSGEANGVEGTPSIFINGEFYTGARDVGSLREYLATKVGGAAVTPVAPGRPPSASPDR